jgi:hypothetical protein
MSSSAATSAEGWSAAGSSAEGWSAEASSASGPSPEPDAPSSPSTCRGSWWCSDRRSWRGRTSWTPRWRWASQASWSLWTTWAGPGRRSAWGCRPSWVRRRWRRRARCTQGGEGRCRRAGRPAPANPWPERLTTVNFFAAVPSAAQQRAWDRGRIPTGRSGPTNAGTWAPHAVPTLFQHSATRGKSAGQAFEAGR